MLSSNFFQEKRVLSLPAAISITWTITKTLSRGIKPFWMRWYQWIPKESNPFLMTKPAVYAEKCRSPLRLKPQKKWEPIPSNHYNIQIQEMSPETELQGNTQSDTFLLQSSEKKDRNQSFLNCNPNKKNLTNNYLSCKLVIVTIIILLMGNRFFKSQNGDFYMSVIKSSKQRCLVLRIVQSTKSHPTADWVYQKARCELPNISLGTVYRNLKILCREKRIQELSFGEGMFRFDGDLRIHSHVRCKECGRVEDVPWFFDTASMKSVEDLTRFRICYHRMEFGGICQDCLNSMAEPSEG